MSENKRVFLLSAENEERKQAERAVRESEERYALAVAGSTDGIWDWDILSNTIFFSDRFKEILGYASKEFPETVETFRSHLHPEDADTVWGAVERHLLERVPYNIKYRLRTKWGKFRWVHACGQATWDDRGNATRMSGSIHDITELKHIEESLRKSEENYRSILKALPGVLYKRYPAWRIEFVDNKVEALAGYISDEFNSGRSKWSDIIVEEDLEIAKDNFIESLEAGEVYTRNYRIRTISGEIKWIEDRGHIVYNNLGKAEYAIGVLYDITDIKNQEAKVRRTQDLLQTVFNTIPDPVVLMDEDLEVKIFNDAALRYYQLEKIEDIIGMCCFEALMGKSAPCEGCQIPAVVKSRKSSSFERKGFMNPERLERVHIYNFVEKGHSSGHALVRIQDISESRLMERKMIHNEKLAALGLTISCITHEITNPISAILVNAPILKDYINAMVSIMDNYAKDIQDFELFKMPYPQFKKDAVKIVESLLHASKRIDTIISNLRKLYGKKRKPRKSWVDIKELAERINTATGIEIRQYAKFFEINIPKKLPKIYTDPEALEQILTNLLINAAHALDKEASRITLDVKQGTTWNDHLIIEIRDNGCGMDPATLSKIFDPFFSTKASGKGTGLGLYICRDLIKDLGGRIEVRSEPGSGSVFRTVLPDIERRSVKRV